MTDPWRYKCKMCENHSFEYRTDGHYCKHCQMNVKLVDKKTGATV